ncbi:hypothetical protein BpHYR1_049691 [Brachionus plicatilis]|uniref:Uncharacterized protein n=1 Tax=Brachionus plicatilis TaxID=10195 RepID=A0A3M7R8Z0_BRAPC|nr:hypothetical protein BpHYR1_049691 [Brachionus plicatilis]
MNFEEKFEFCNLGSNLDLNNSLYITIRSINNSMKIKSFLNSSRKIVAKSANFDTKISISF